MTVKKFLSISMSLVCVLFLSIGVVNAQVPATNTVTVKKSTLLGNNFPMLVDVLMGADGENIKLPPNPVIGSEVTFVVDNSNTHDFTVDGNGHTVNFASTVTVPGASGPGTFAFVFQNGNAGAPG